MPTLIRTTLAVLAALCAFSPVSAREWKATPKALAQDYAFIQDSRPDGRMIMIMWLAPEMIDEGSEILRRDVVIGVVDGRMDALGVITYGNVDSITLTDASGAPMRMLSSNEMPPTVAALLTGMEGIFAKAMGPLGQNFHWLVFDGSKIKSCAQNAGFTVNFADEHYTYMTPIPGCPK